MRRFLYNGSDLSGDFDNGRSSFARCKGFRYFCGICGSIWGKLDFTDSPIRTYHSINLPCANHTSQWNRGGSFLKPILWWDTPGTLSNLLETLPDPVVRHEALMACLQILKANND